MLFKLQGEPQPSRSSSWPKRSQVPKTKGHDARLPEINSELRPAVLLWKARHRSRLYFGTKELWRLGGWGAHSRSAPNGLPRPQPQQHKGALSPGRGESASPGREKQTTWATTLFLPSRHLQSTWEPLQALKLAAYNAAQRGKVTCSSSRG